MPKKTRTDNVEYHKGREDFKAGKAPHDCPYSLADLSPDSRGSRWWLGYFDEKAGK